ncbi:serine hydrolase domain-containing protein [Phenylobacterium sp.]|uniref:serine hydrolase domain-containing protein n=1 Tax=Phenylobacterium sp. TaxID=1871053 RepID=UPI0035B36490
MAATRRSLIAAATAFALPALLPLAADGRERRGKPVGCRERAAYVGEGLRPQLFPQVFDAAAASAGARAHMVIHDSLDEAFDKAAGRMKPAAFAAAVIAPDGGQWNQLRAPRGAPEPDRFLWTGAEQVFVATAVLQMVEEGKVSLDDKLAKWAPDAPGAAVVAVDDLLSQTSGLADIGAPAAFCPGANWAPSPGGQAMLGKIVEAVDGAPVHQALTKRIVQRLRLEETTVLAPGQTLEGLAGPAAAGGVAASALDMVRFWRGLMANRLHGEAITRGRFYRLYPMTGAGPGYYGQGVMVTDLYKIDQTARDTWLGYTQATAAAAYSVERDAFAAVALTGEGSAEDALRQIFKALPKVKTA